MTVLNSSKINSLILITCLSWGWHYSKQILHHQNMRIHLLLMKILFVICFLIRSRCDEVVSKRHYPLEILKIHKNDSKTARLMQSCVSEYDLVTINSFTSLFPLQNGLWPELEAVYLLADESEKLSGALVFLMTFFCNLGGHLRGPSLHLTSN